MNNVPQNTDEVALQQEISTWYRQQAIEVPPPQLDQDILRRAQAHLIEMHPSQLTSVEVNRSFWRRYPWALSSAASLVLVIGLVVLNRPQVEDILAPTLMSAPTPQTMNAVGSTAMESSVVESTVLESTKNTVTESTATDSTTTAMPSQSRHLGPIDRQERATSEQQAKIAVEGITGADIDEMSSFRAAHTSRDQGAVSQSLPLAESLQRLAVLIEDKNIEQALVLEQKMLVDYPDLTDKNIMEGKSTARQYSLFLQFKHLQNQLHKTVK